MSNYSSAGRKRERGCQLYESSLLVVRTPRTMPPPSSSTSTTAPIRPSLQSIAAIKSLTASHFTPLHVVQTTITKYYDDFSFSKEEGRPTWGVWRGSAWRAGWEKGGGKTNA
eukprot:scaffold9367_cov141-Skeletonema_marinoi.AAC.7